MFEEFVPLFAKMFTSPVIAAKTLAKQNATIATIKTNNTVADLSAKNTTFFICKLIKVYVLKNI